MQGISTDAGRREAREESSRRRMRAARSSDHQDLVTQMKGNPFENVAIAMIVGTKAPTVIGNELNRVDDRHDRTVEERQRDRGVDFDELARFFAATVVA